MPVLHLNLGDQLTLKKKHPCGSFVWAVTRLGADIGLTCTGCQRKVLIPRSKLDTRIKKIARAEPETAL